MPQSAIHQETTSLEPSALVSLFQLDLTSLGGDLLNFTTELRAGARVSFGGVQYAAVPVEIDGMTISGTGALQTPTLTIGNTDGLIQSIVNSLGDLAGCKLTRWRTFARFLDGGVSPDPTTFYGPDVYKIDRKSADTPEQIQWELSTLVDTQGMYVGRTMIRDTCMWRYRSWNAATGTWDYSKAKCPYAGTRYYDINNRQVASPSLDVPARNRGCCEVRFGARAALPFGGFPGILRGV